MSNSFISLQGQGLLSQGHEVRGKRYFLDDNAWSTLFFTTTDSDQSVHQEWAGQLTLKTSFYFFNAPSLRFLTSTSLNTPQSSSTIENYEFNFIELKMKPKSNGSVHSWGFGLKTASFEALEFWRVNWASIESEMARKAPRSRNDVQNSGRWNLKNIWND